MARTDADKMDKSLQKHCKGKELVHCSMARMEFALLLMHLSFSDRLDPSLQHPK